MEDKALKDKEELVALENTPSPTESPIGDAIIRITVILGLTIAVGIIAFFMVATA